MDASQSRQHVALFGTPPDGTELGGGRAPAWCDVAGRPRDGGCWDLTQKPLLLAGADGISHETRPTTSLARDLACHSEPTSVARAASPLPTPAVVQRRPAADGDERPIRSSLGWGGRSSGSKESPAPVKASTADRPLTGFADRDRPAAGFSSGFASPSSSTPARRKSFGLTGASPKGLHVGTPPSLSKPGRGESQDLPRRISRQYEPIHELLQMGFDEASARAAIAAAGGDVDRALRLVLEDSKAHDARIQSEWEFEGDMGWVPFEAEMESVMKEAVAKGQSVCEVRARGNHYFIDFDNLTQLNLTTQRTRQIRRRRDPTT